MKYTDAGKGFATEAKVASEGHPYQLAMISFGERWADLMEPRIEAGEKLEDIAEQTGREADIEGITGHMYNGGVLFLVHSWIYGETLRKWHNKDSGVPDSKGTVNSCILNVG